MFPAEQGLIRFAAFIGGLLVFFLLEIRIPYRESTVSRRKRWVINLSFSAFNSVVLAVAFASAIVRAAQYVTANHLGVLDMIHMPYWVKTLATVVIMDFMLYVWHLLTHMVPFLWRFHRVHHSDLNMDVSTATRFHIGELAISAVIKISLIFFLGADLLGVLLFESLLVFCAQFHHSSLRVPWWFEKCIWVLFVPPSMHRIHHSVIINERNTNYGTISSLWDRILGTLLVTVDQSRIRIGIGAYPQSDKLTFFHLLIMPFTRPVK